MRALTSVGPTADQDAVTAAEVINNISVTVADRAGPCLLFGTIGYVDTDVLGVIHTARILQEGVAVPGAIVSQETGAVDNIAGRITVMGFAENVAIGQTFTLDIASAGTGIDVKAGNAQLMVVALGAQAAEVAALVDP